ncbi:polyprenyl synthetase family protein [SAR86 cluster bacterium]|nr:polyprenyl synthetase family protein [SAR86 cluster bacterium]
MMNNENSFLEHNLSRINEALLESLPEENFSEITKAIHYSVMNGGKRLRPQLMLLMADALKVDVCNKTIDLMAAAGELIHCYSLIHDDLPAMDDDDFRRGQLSCHKKFDEATAILAGDAIQPLSLEILTSIQDDNLNDSTKSEIINIFAKACGPKGMVEGQNLDIKSESKNLNEDELDRIHFLKTGKLIEACILSVCLLKKEIKEEEVSKLVEFSEKFGLAFQIRDDILDVIGNEREIGKPVGSDKEKNKSTYASLLGITKSQLKAEKLSKEAIDILISLPYETKRLEDLCKMIIERDA